MKWSDFGLARPVNERGTYSTNEIHGTEKWLAPELLKLLGHEHSSGKINEKFRGTIKSDVYAEGLVFGYFLSNGQHPFGFHFLEIPSNITGNNPVNINSKNLASVSS